MYDYNDEFYNRHAPGLCMAIININKFVRCGWNIGSNTLSYNFSKEKWSVVVDIGIDRKTIYKTEFRRSHQHNTSRSVFLHEERWTSSLISCHAVLNPIDRLERYSTELDDSPVHDGRWNNRSPHNLWGEESLCVNSFPNSRRNSGSCFSPCAETKSYDSRTRRKMALLRLLQQQE